jgi:hypothetical protein
MVWIGLVWLRIGRALANSVLNLRVPYNAGKLSSVQTTRDLSSSAQLHGVRMGDVDWIGLTKDRDRWRGLVNSVLSVRVP